MEIGPKNDIDQVGLNQFLLCFKHGNIHVKFMEISMNPEIPMQHGNSQGDIQCVNLVRAW